MCAVVLLAISAAVLLEMSVAVLLLLGVPAFVAMVEIPADVLLQGVQQHRVRVNDVSDSPIGDHLDAAIEFVRPALKSGGRVYVHCAIGVSRASTVVIAYCMQVGI